MYHITIAASYHPCRLNFLTLTSFVWQGDKVSDTHCAQLAEVIDCQQHICSSTCFCRAYALGDETIPRIDTLGMKKWNQIKILWWFYTFSAESSQTSKVYFLVTLEKRISGWQKRRYVSAHEPQCVRGVTRPNYSQYSLTHLVDCSEGPIRRAGQVTG